jgi:ABC-2 type transport system ATP-binding protein
VRYITENTSVCKFISFNIYQEKRKGLLDLEHIITTNNLSKKYGNVYRVKDVDLKIPTNTIYGFLGPNGSGKSTTLKMILGLDKPTEGEINVFGKLSNDKNRLDNQKDKKVNQYSLGMKQRLGLSAALLDFPKLLILDEPTNGLDPAGIQEMRICSLPKEYGMTVVVSSHLLSEIDQMANTVGIINHGELIFQDNLETLHERSQHKIAIKTLDNAKARSVLNDQGIICDAESEYLLLPQTSNDLIIKCNELFYENKIMMLRIEERQKSLEDIFLELTGKAVSL